MKKKKSRTQTSVHSLFSHFYFNLLFIYLCLRFLFYFFSLRFCSFAFVAICRWIFKRRSVRLSSVCSQHSGAYCCVFVSDLDRLSIFIDAFSSLFRFIFIVIIIIIIHYLCGDCERSGHCALEAHEYRVVDIFTLDEGMNCVATSSSLRIPVRCL